VLVETLLLRVSYELAPVQRSWKLVSGGGAGARGGRRWSRWSLIAPERILGPHAPESVGRFTDPSSVGVSGVDVAVCALQRAVSLSQFGESLLKLFDSDHLLADRGGHAGGMVG
jgi:hypothetical protein